jgi:hypothetical protein
MPTRYFSIYIVFSWLQRFDFIYRSLNWVHIDRVITRRRLRWFVVRRSLRAQTRYWISKPLRNRIARDLAIIRAAAVINTAAPSRWLAGPVAGCYFLVICLLRVSLDISLAYLVGFRTGKNGTSSEQSSWQPPSSQSSCVQVSRQYAPSCIDWHRPFGRQVSQLAQQILEMGLLRSELHGEKSGSVTAVPFRW